MQFEEVLLAEPTYCASQSPSAYPELKQALMGTDSQRSGFKWRMLFQVDQAISWISSRPGVGNQFARVLGVGGN